MPHAVRHAVDICLEAKSAQLVSISILYRIAPLLVKRGIVRGRARCQNRMSTLLCLSQRAGMPSCDPYDYLSALTQKTRRIAFYLSRVFRVFLSNTGVYCPATFSGYPFFSSVITVYPHDMFLYPQDFSYVLSIFVSIPGIFPYILLISSVLPRILTDAIIREGGRSSRRAFI